MGKNLTYQDLKKITQNLESELADAKKKKAKAQSIFDEFKKIAERLQSGIYRFDVKSRKFLFFNRAAVELLGSKSSQAKEVTSRSILLRIHPDDREKVRKAVKDSIEVGRNRGDVEYRFARRDGSFRWYYDRWLVMRDRSGFPRYIEGIVIDNSDRKLAELALEESEKKLRLLSSHLLKAQERERRRIALELHDDLGQGLTVLKLQLRSLKMKLTAEHDNLRDDCERSYGYVDRIIDNVRRLSHDLCPSCLEDLGLDTSIRTVIDDFAKHAGIHVSFDSPKIDPLFLLESKTVIYRIFQETFTNIQKHAQARNVSVVIKKDHTMVDFQVTDDGKGFAVEPGGDGMPVNRGLGLTAMTERARMLGGSFKIYSIIGIGTRIVFRIPID